MSVPVVTLLVLVRIAQWAVKILTALSRRPVLVGLGIVVFALSGTALIVVPAIVAGWWREFTMGLGTSLLLTGTVEIGVLGVLNAALNNKGREPAQGPAQIAATLRRLADSLDAAPEG